MSRLPPLPPGLPPKPSSDSYRPAPPLHENYFTRQEPAPPMYQFRGSANADPRDSYRPRSPPPRHNYDSYNSYESRGHYDNSPSAYNPPARPRSRDDYRPSSSGFTFRYDAPPSISAHQGDSWRPQSPPRKRGYWHDEDAASRNSSRGDRPSYQRSGPRGRPFGRGRGAPRLASDRAFLKGNRAPTPELMPGMDGNDSQEVRYKPAQDLSDSDEAEMDGDGQPAKKRARTEYKPEDGSRPQWSNPDPYTALPPPDESQRKKKDVLKLIRKARVESSSGSRAAADADAGDFISLDFSGELDEEVSAPVPSGKGVVGAPSGPRALLHPRQSLNTPNAASVQAPLNDITNKPPSIQHVVDLTSDDNLGSRKRNAHDEIKASRSALDTTADPNLGGRKRSVRDLIVNPPPLLYKTMRGKPPSVNGQILKEWRVSEGETGTPWHVRDHSDTASMGVWLHKEIVDFYEYVKPREFEHFIRMKVVEDLREKVRETFPTADIHCFGSFPAGLYLPTADMDLVCVSDEFMRFGRKTIGQGYKQIRAFGDFVTRNDLAIPGTMEMISKARVPLIKYVDRLTGLKVDISFENSTGLVANKTFQDWKAQYPAMPILATLIKHLLAMRGLNEPVNGGIGGFSVICLVVSLLQNMPQVQSRSMIPEHHLGEILMEFFDLYGNQFDVTTTAIQFDPPGYVSKARIGTSVYRGGSQYKFCILDPNNPENDISGGASNTSSIRDFFSRAYSTLHKRMGDLRYSSNRKDENLLGCIFAGNYITFKLQREHLEHIYNKRFAPITD